MKFDTNKLDISTLLADTNMPARDELAIGGEPKPESETSTVIIVEVPLPSRIIQSSISIFS